MNKPATANPVFSEVLQHIQQARRKIFSQANTALIDLYRQIGLDIKGFSDKNLWLMKHYRADEKLSPLAREIRPTYSKPLKTNMCWGCRKPTAKTICKKPLDSDDCYSHRGVRHESGAIT